MIDVLECRRVRCTKARAQGSAAGLGSVHTPGHLVGFACADIVEEAPKLRTH